MKLTEKIKKIRDDGEYELQTLTEKYNNDFKKCKERVLKEIYDLCNSYGKVVCEVCGGVGTVLRMDAGYMRKFGLKDWEDCKNCGGNGHK